MPTDVLDSLLDLVDTELLDFTEDARDGINRARLIQGDSQFEKDQALNKTPRYLGGIGLSVDGLPEEILQKATIVTLEKGDWAVFTSLEVVVLANSRVRRFFAEIDNQKKLACGTNQDGQNAHGWNGKPCNTCQYYPKNFDGDKKYACTASIQSLIYIPELNHTAILQIKGASYMDGTAWLSQLSVLSKKFAERPEVKAKNPTLARVNSFFFKTTLYASEFKQGKENKFQTLAFNKAGAPYRWDELVNSAEVITRSKDILKQMEEGWTRLYVGHNPNAVMSLASADSPIAALPGGTDKITVTAQADTAQPAESQVTQPDALAVSTIAMDDDPADDEAEEDVMKF